MGFQYFAKTTPLLRSAVLAISIPLIWGVNACNTPPQTPANQERILRYETGVVSQQVSLVNGQKQGKMTEFYPDGSLKSERWFENDQQTGRTVFYYQSGKLKEVQYYSNGQQTSGDTIWYEDGALQFTVNFEKSKKNGYLRKFSPDGKLVLEARYSNDSLLEVKGKPVR